MRKAHVVGNAGLGTEPHEPHAPIKNGREPAPLTRAAPPLHFPFSVPASHGRDGGQVGSGVARALAVSSFNHGRTDSAALPRANRHETKRIRQTNSGPSPGLDVEFTSARSGTTVVNGRGAASARHGNRPKGLRDAACRGSGGCQLSVAGSDTVADRVLMATEGWQLHSRQALVFATRTRSLGSSWSVAMPAGQDG